MAEPRVVIVGAGIAGLCAGVYARKAGFEVEILEMGESSGGLATSWRRGGYTFENCVDWLLGSRPGGPWHTRWSEVFDIDALTFVDRAELTRLVTEDGESLGIPVQPDLLERELLQVAPEDRQPIHELASAIRRLMRVEPPMPGLFPWWNPIPWARMIALLPQLRTWARMTVADFAQRFRNPLLRRLFGSTADGRMSALVLVLPNAWMAKGDAGYPVGGSRAVIQPIESRLRELGGSLRFNAQVEQILVSGGRARGVRLRGGEEVRADWVISAADGHATLFDWLPAPLRRRELTRPYEEIPTFPSYLHVSLGVRRDLGAQPRAFSYALNAPLQVDPGTRASELFFRVFNFDPTFAPAGCTAVTCLIPTRNHAYWTELQRSNPEEYAARKNGIAGAVAGALDRHIPGARADIEVMDVSTPATVVRYTGNWKGSSEGFLPTPAVGIRPIRMTVPGLDRFLMVGQWVQPGGGLPIGLLTARRGVARLCRATGRTFSPRAAPSREGRAWPTVPTGAR